MKTLPEHGTNNSDKIMPQAVKEGIVFTGMRYFDTALWLGGLGAGVYAQSKLGVPAAVAAPAVAAGVTAIEYPLSGVAMDFFTADSPDEDIESKALQRRFGRAGKIGREAFVLGYAACAGATSAVEVNNNFGLESTRLRRLGQAALYGIGTSLWITDIPPFDQGRELVSKWYNEFIDNPVATTGASVGVSLGVLGASKGIKAGRTKYQNWRSKKNKTKSEITA